MIACFIEDDIMIDINENDHNYSQRFSCKSGSLIEQEGIASRNQFILEALELKVREIENLGFDMEFALMASDPEYQEEALQLEQEFLPVDREMTV